MIDHPESEATATCTFCPKLCRPACPVAEVERRETVTPQALMSAIHLQSQGMSALAGEAAEVLYHCLECRRCQQHCQEHIDVPKAIAAARFEAWDRGDAPPRAKRSAAKFRTHGNPFGRDLRPAARAAVPEGRTSSAAEVVVFPDCATVAHHPEQLAATLKVLDAASIEAAVYVSDVSCCGAPLYHAGDLDAFSTHARKVHKALKGKTKIIVPSPGCAHLLRDVYPELGLKWSGEIQHPVEALAGRIERLDLHPPADAPPTVYQDPCHLARSLGQVEAPRELLAAATGQRPREPFYSGARATCCGGGGGMPEILPEIAAQVAAVAVTNLAPRKGETVVTACSGCRRRLERAGIQAPVRDLMEILASALDARS